MREKSSSSTHETSLLLRLSRSVMPPRRFRYFASRRMYIRFLSPGPISFILFVKRNSRKPVSDVSDAAEVPFQVFAGVIVEREKENARQFVGVHPLRIVGDMAVPPKTGQAVPQQSPVSGFARRSSGSNMNRSTFPLSRPKRSTSHASACSPSTRRAQSGPEPGVVCLEWGQERKGSV